MNKIIFIGVLIGLLFTQSVQAATGSIPVNIEETLDRVMDFLLHDLPALIKGIFEENVLPIWNRMYEWFKENIWEKIKPLTTEEIERRKEIAEEEARKEREELLAEIGEISIKNDIWEKVKDFLTELWN